MPEIIDIHVHFGGPRNSKNGCYWSETFKKQPAYWLLKLTSYSLFKEPTFEEVERKILSVINGAKKVDKVVLLAMDKVYDLDGNPREKEGNKEITHLYVPNDYIIQLAKKNHRILVGASVHPYRNDWKGELNKCLSNGAVLCKWIPSSQQIDVTNEKCFPMYDYLAKHNLPLLVHSGPEYSIPTSDDRFIEFNNPKYLRAALDRGVTVIIAHCSLPYFGALDTKYQDDMEEFYKLFEESKNKPWKLYADLSAIAEPLRNAYVPDILAKIPQDRLLFGSDYPIPPSEFSYKKSKNIIKWIRLTIKAFSIRNPLDKNYFILKKMGFDEQVFYSANSLLNKSGRNFHYANN